MAKYSNIQDIPLSLGVWLLHDTYDHQDDENYISATSLIRPVRQSILESRLTDTRKVDLADLISVSLGRSIHDAVERAWMDNPQAALEALGYPKKQANRILVNPTKESIKALADQGIDEHLPVFIEQRHIKNVGKWRVGGKFDMVIDGIVNDLKFTSTYTYMNNSRLDDYVLQLSLYRWLCPHIITEDFGYINFIFSNWEAHQAKANPNYPQSRIIIKEIQLMSLAEVETWVRRRLQSLDTNWDLPEAALPECTDKELWRSETVYKYYRDPTKTDGRSTKNFSSLREAQVHKGNCKNGGVIITVPGSPKRCGYCSVASICTQKNRYFL